MRWGGAFGAAISLALAACTTDGTVTGALPDQARSPAPSIAFEQIDGPPPHVFYNLVQALGDEAETQHVDVVSRDGPAAYRVRGYLAAAVTQGETSIAWAFDVYDASDRRLRRIAGEEKAGAAARDAWALASDDLLRRIARAGMAQLATLPETDDARTAQAQVALAERD